VRGFKNKAIGKRISATKHLHSAPCSRENHLFSAEAEIQELYCMATVTFDTLKFVETLKEASFTRTSSQGLSYSCAGVA
jgi:hypothetical protein